MNKSKNVGIAWYQREQWTLLKQTAFDKEAIENTFEEWEIKAKRMIKKMKSNGIFVVAVPFDVNVFNKWCMDKGKIPNGESRAEYVASYLKMNTKR